MSELGLEGRRKWLTRAVYALGGLIGATLASTAGIYLLGSRRGGARSPWIEAGSLDTLPVGTAAESIFRRTKLDGWKIVSEKQTVWLARLSEKEVAAFNPQCTHLGCAYSYDERKHEFVCPCHTSNFALDGGVLTGPAPRALDRYLVKIENGKILVGGFDGQAKES